jgi:hypothetical protein
LGTIGEDPLLAVVHLAVLLAFTAIGSWFAVRTVTAKLLRG